jgi:hypothetical protein
MGAIAVKQVLDRVRIVLKDTGDPPKWPGNDLLPFVGTGEADIMARRPDAAQDDATGAMLTPTPAVTEGGSLALSTRWLPALVHWVLMWAFRMEGKDRPDEDRAKDQQSAYTEALK